MPKEQLKTKEVNMRDWVGNIVFSPEITMTDHLAKVLAMQAAGIEVAARCGYEAGIRIHAVEVSRTGVSFVIISEINEKIVEFFDHGLPGLRDLMTGVDGEADWVGGIVKFNGVDGKLRLGYFFPEPKKEGFGKLNRDWEKVRPLAGVLGRGVSGKLHVLNLAEEGIGQTLLLANDLKAVSEMTGLILTSLRQGNSDKQLVYAIPEDTKLALSDRLRARQLFSEGITTAKALTELLAIVAKRKGQEWQKAGGARVLAVIDLAAVDFSNREQRGNFARLMSLEPQYLGIHLFLTGTAGLDKEVLDNFVTPIIETLYVSGGHYNSTHWLANDVDPFGRPFTSEWVRIMDGKETVFLPAKL